MFATDTTIHSHIGFKACNFLPVSLVVYDIALRITMIWMTERLGSTLATIIDLPLLLAILLFIPKSPAMLVAL